MKLPNPYWIKVAGISGALAIGLGAFGAHGLKNVVKEERFLKAFETGAHYHLIHSLALLMCAFLPDETASYFGNWIIFGISLFSGRFPFFFFTYRIDSTSFSN
eukprot:TRINITY_DN43131_c0_g1_i1.p1 TRINITY_DN43131_c0_g1~~TRINITY_DN43131_c0_g1_i1.p1  ORF type:complete len:103 (-),score=2.97 TRINITY_DN43131_c0_g1_i1:3-311(-)